MVGSTPFVTTMTMGKPSSNVISTRRGHSSTTIQNTIEGQLFTSSQILTGGNMWSVDQVQLEVNLQLLSIV